MDREEVFDLLTLVGLRLSAATTRGCAAMGLTETEARVISCVAVSGATRPGAVGADLGLSPRHMTQLADSLDAKGHIVREVDPTDARARILRLTPSGVSLVKQIDALRDAWARDLLDDVSAKDLSTLAMSLTAILKRLTG